jgi:hypothetical protein
MQRISKRVLGPMVAAALSLAPLQSVAAVGTETGRTDLRSIGEVAAQIGEWATESSNYSLEMLGITEMECDCTFTLNDEEQLWLFHAEPKIKGVDRYGPSYGKLRKGDVIVAIDGMLITTRKAGMRFANLVAGEPVQFTVRRWGRTRSETIVPRIEPEPEVPIELTVRRSASGGEVTVVPEAEPISEFARSIEELSKTAAELGKTIDLIGLPALPDIPSIPELNLDFAARTPRGWIGFGLSFSGSIRGGPSVHSGRGTKFWAAPGEWRFNEPPSIKSIQPGGPAEKAGLEVGDVLLEIDGVKLDSDKGGDRFSRMEPGQTIEWKVERGGKTFTVQTKAVERPEREQVEAPLEPLLPDSLRPLRYTGTLSGTEIEVRGGEDVKVEVDKETGQVVIRSGDSVVRLKSKEER